MNNIKNILLIALILISITSFAQESTANLHITLKNNSGKPHRYIKISLRDKDTDEIFKATTNSNGEADFILPADGNFEITFSNSQLTRSMRMPDQEGISLKSTYTYNGGKDDWSKKFPPSTTQKRQWEHLFNQYADTVNLERETRISNYDERFQEFSIKLTDLNAGNLANEIVYLRAKNHKKVFYGITNKYGELSMLIPKGDIYYLDFVYDKAFEELDVKLALGHSRQRISIQYIGTREIERRKKEEELRLVAEEKEMKKSREKFALRMKTLGKSEIEGYKEELKDYKKEEAGIVSEVLNRNTKWHNKLIVCDLTGSMNPYSGDLIKWYSDEIKKDKNLQFVFFNDGNNIDDEKKVIGKTGGIYYSDKPSIKNTINLMAKVQYAGDGGDGAENNIEAIIEGSIQARAFNSLIMIADNDAPVKDMILLDKVNKPVHIILCGVDDWIEEDYLTIAYRTKGSIHTMMEDFNNISRTRNGGRITINGIEYLLMSNRFVMVE